MTEEGTAEQPRKLTETEELAAKRCIAFAEEAASGLIGAKKRADDGDWWGVAELLQHAAAAAAMGTVGARLVGSGAD